MWGYSSCVVFDNGQNGILMGVESDLGNPYITDKKWLSFLENLCIQLWFMGIEEKRTKYFFPISNLFY